MPDLNHLTRRGFGASLGGAVAASAIGLPGCTPAAPTIGAPDIAELEAALGHKVASPADPGAYDAARHIWNGLFDRRPAALAPCANAHDVATCIRFAKDKRVPLSVLSGGHHPAGLAMNDGGIVIDLSGLTDIAVDPVKRTVRVGPGVRVGAMNAATEPHGLVVPAAAYPTVGMGGMSLGGGIGWFTEFGLTSDNILSAEMVLADGRVVQVDQASEPDLFWAIRGGGGNFGVVTALELQGHALPPLMYGMFAYPLPMAGAVAGPWAAHTAAAAPDLASALIFTRQPMPAMLMVSKTGRPLAEARQELATLQAFAPPVQAKTGTIGLTAFQMMAAQSMDGGSRFYTKSHYLRAITPAVVEIMQAAVAVAPSPFSVAVINTMGGVIAAVPVAATAFPHRGCSYALYAEARWSDARDDARNIAWVRDWWQKLSPHATGEVYGNYHSEVDNAAAHRAFGPNYARLAAIKRTYDPDNLFANAAINVRPA